MSVDNGTLHAQVRASAVDGAEVDDGVGLTPEHAVQACSLFEFTQARIDASFSFEIFTSESMAALLLTDSTGNGFDFSSALSDTITPKIGQSYVVANTLLLTAAAFSGFSSSVNALNTSSFYITPDGVSDVTASFNTYPLQTRDAAVPEPASLLLLGTGLAALAYRRRRRRILPSDRS